MAGAGSAQYGGGPTPWWQLPQGGGRSGQDTLTNLQNSAPPGYEYDPVTMSYNRTPASAGGRAGQYTSSFYQASPFGGALSGLQGAAANIASGATSGTGGGVGASGTPGAVGSVGAGGAVGGAGAAPGVPGQINTLAMPNMQAAQEAAYAGAKDRVGLAAKAGLQSLEGELGAQGMLGGGAQVQGVKDIIASGEQELGQVSRDLAQTQAGQALDIAKTGYEGGITQRGQDIQSQEAQAQLALQQNQAAFQQQYLKNQQMQNLLQLALSGLGAGAGLGYGPGSGNAPAY